MAAILLDGEALAAQERAELSKRVAELKARRRHPRARDDPRRRRRPERPLRGDEAPGLRRDRRSMSVHEELPADVTQAQLESVVRSLSANPDVDALLDPVAVAEAT